MAILILLLFPQLSWLSYFALIVTLHQFLLLFYSIGYIIPIRYLFGSFMCLQMLLGPVLAYNGMDKFQTGNSKMQIPEAEYFFYVLPAVIAFIAGLHIWSNKLQGEIIDMDLIRGYTRDNNNMPYVLIGIGFVSGLLADNISSELSFVFYLRFSAIGFSEPLTSKPYPHIKFFNQNNI